MELTPKHIQLLKDYKALPIEDRVRIISTINELRISKKVVDTKTLENLLAATGHFDIALACYTAQLSNIPWR
jgi:hypothetical protein